MLVLMLVAWTLAALRVGVSAAVTTNISSVDWSQIPACGLTCIVGKVELSPCSITDFNCICANNTIASQIDHCLQDTCAVRDALKTAKTAKDMCGYKPHDEALIVWLVPLIVVSLSTICYILRMIFRLGVRAQRIDLSDIIMGVSVLCTIPFLWSAFQLAFEGLGKDMWNIPADNITKILKLYWWDELLYQAILPLTRISILLFYLDIFPRRPTRIANFTIIGFNIAYLIAFEFATIFQCIPVDGAWRFWDGTYATKCNNIHLQSWVSAAGNIALDLATIILPMPELARLSISRRKKVQIVAMFSLGFFITIISIIRLKGLIMFANTTNVTYDYVQPGLFSIVEASAGIICACLPSIRALLGRLFPKVFATTGNGSGNMYGDSSKPSRTKFSRLESTPAPGQQPAEPQVQQRPWSPQINVKTEWSVQEHESSSVELVPVEIGGGRGAHAYANDKEDVIYGQAI